VVRLAAAHAKNRRSAVQPIPVDVVPMLAAYLARRAPDQPVWPGTWTQDASQMIRHDLEAAGIPYVVQTPDWPLYADMHALRHSFIAMLDKPGVTLKQAMQLARHSDPRLTMKIYGRAALADLAAAVDGAFGGFATPPDDPSPATIPFRVAK
jgi:integrase